MHNSLINNHLLITLLILIFFILEFVILLGFNLQFMSCNLKMKKKTTIFYRSSIYICVVLLFTAIFIWRIYNINKCIILPEMDLRIPNFKELKLTFKLILKSLEYLEVYNEISMYHLLLGFFVIFLSIILWFILFLTSLIYIKSRAYSAHIYFLKFKFYEEAFRKIFVDLNIKINLPIDEYVGNNYANKNPFHRYMANFLFARPHWLNFIVNYFIIVFPIYLLFYDIYLYNCISKLFYWLPWIYLLVLCRILNKLGTSTFAPRRYGSDNTLSKTLYTHNEYTKFIVSCLKLTPIKIKRRKVR